MWTKEDQDTLDSLMKKYRVYRDNYKKSTERVNDFLYKMRFDRDQADYMLANADTLMKIIGEYATKPALEWSDTNPEKLNHADALAWCESLGKGWRLPSRAELIYAYDNQEPGFQPVYYWSSTSLTTSPNFAWVVYFDNGNVGANTKPSGTYVRAVRGGL